MPETKRFFYYRHYFLRMVVFLYYHLGEHGFLILLGILTGLLTGAGAGLMKYAALRLSALAPYLHDRNWLIPALLLPAFGLAISFVLTRLLLHRHRAANLSWVIYDLRKQQPHMQWEETFAHILTGAITIGTGGSAGLETPGVLTGFAIGGRTGILCRLPSDKRGTLMGCGSAASTAAIFGTPIAGALFAAEVIFPRKGHYRLIPLLPAAAAGAIIAEMIFGTAQMFVPRTEQWTFGALPWMILLGAFCALEGIYLIRVNHLMSTWIERRFPNRALRLLFGGAGLSAILWAFPHLAGNGYGVIQSLFDGTFAQITTQTDASTILLMFILAALFLKIIATALTVSCGGDGGIFAPTLFAGAFTGFFFVRFLNEFFHLGLPEANFIVIGMCGVFTAALRAPLTGIFLIGEMTGDILLMVPLMLVAGLSYALSGLIEPFSIYTKELGAKHLMQPVRLGKSNRARSVRSVLSTDFTPVKAGTTQAELREIEAKAKIPYLPVLDAESHLLGVVVPQKIRGTRGVCRTASQLMIHPLLTLSPDDDAVRARICFEIYGLEYLPVTEKGRFAGFVPRTKFPKLEIPDPSPPPPLPGTPASLAPDQRISGMK